MSRAGRRGRLARLEAAERVSADVSDDAGADRAEWVWRVGTRGWEIEQARRRGIRTQVTAARWRSALWRNQRQAA